MGRENLNFPTFLSWMYIYRQTFNSMDFAHILYFCNVRCRSAENMVVEIIIIIIIMTMMNSRRRKEYLRTVTFGSVNTIPHLLLYSSITLNCHTVNSLFRLPHSMLKVLYRTVLHVISLVRRNSNCCEAQNVTFCSRISTGKCIKPHLQMTAKLQTCRYISNNTTYKFRLYAV